MSRSRINRTCLPLAGTKRNTRRGVLASTLPLVALASCAPGGSPAGAPGVPRGPVARRNRATVDGWSLWREGKSQPEAWELLRFLQTDEWWDINMPLTFQQPTRISLQARYADVLKRANPALAGKRVEVFGDPVTKGYARPQTNWRLDDEALKSYQKAWDDSVMDNKAPVPDAFRQAALEIANLHKQQLGT